jgi:uncharacterized protein (DUF1501 family)
LLENTLVIWMGEFGRTPKINGSNGRDHWPYAQTVVMAGGGVRGGQVIGSTNERAETPKDRPLKPDDVVATVLNVMGIDHTATVPSAGGRPVHIARDGTVIQELV